MSTQLSKTPEELRKEFAELKSRDDIARLLDITTNQLKFHLYVLPSHKRYKIFVVPKKSGESRIIIAPKSPIKIIQEKLKQVLDAVYQPKPAAHGFILGRSVVTNARLHKKRRYVLNIDLKDFFPTIHFGRVRGMFMGNPYYFNAEVATVLAQICCHNRILPQGAPTSPVISNMICVRLDAKLQQLARRNNCTYSRYADDITFSTNRSKFPSALGMLLGVGQIGVGDELVSVIEENGFKINPNKTRLQVREVRQEVTGLTVNRYPNVQRRYIKQVRAILHAWSKYGLESTAQRYFEKYSKHKYADPKANRPPFQKVVKGKIEFISMVKGKNSSVYRSLLGKFAQLAPDYVKDDYVDAIPQIQVSIYTEGKTDGKHLNAALAFFQNQRSYRQISLVCLDNQGFDNLEKRLDFAVGHTDKNTKPHIFIFDRDIDKTLRKKVGGDEQYKGWGNGVYSLLLPLPKNREETPDISIEFYYKDEDISRKDERGRRLFLSTEFNKSTGRHWVEDLNCITLHKLGNPLKVIDDKVFNNKNENVAMSKDEFAENVRTKKFENIDFIGFTTLFEILSMIIADFNVET